MFVSYNWLKEYVDLSSTNPEELAEKITRSGIEVEGVELPGEGIKGIVIGHVLECEQHPDADKLNKCLVDIGQESPVQIICGAPNVAKGQYVPVATVGAVLSGNFKIKKAKLRGEESHGMICSLQELGIESKMVSKEFEDGIFVFSDQVKAGDDALAALNLDDAILELGLTPNRSDCLSMIGVAYEVAAILSEEVKLQETLNESPVQEDEKVSIRIENSEDNPHYVAKVIKGIKVGTSPMWLKTRLIAGGIRPINNIVDITNYVLLEYGQPLHAFDYDRFGSKKIVVRRAHHEEKITTLDGVERILSSDDLVITNGQEPVAIAGVMGGADSEVTDQTNTVLLESAYFAGKCVRKSSKDHGLRSEASARFEKGVDPNRVYAAANRAANLMVELAGGTIVSETIEGTPIAHDRTISITLEKINRVLGTSIQVKEVESIFNDLKFDYEVEGETFTVHAPSRRGDIQIEEDLLEEIARIYGYDRLPLTLPKGEATPGGLNKYQAQRRVSRRLFEGAGLYQAITYSLTSEKKATQFALDKRDPIRLLMPMSEERSYLRLSILPQLLESVSYNVARQMDRIAYYEMGSVFLKEEGQELPKEEEHVAGALTGLWQAQPWQGEKKPIDFYVVKGIVEAWATKLGVIESISYEAAEIDGMHPGRTATVLLNGKPIGFLGQLHPNVQKELDLKETFVFEIKASPLFLADLEPLHYTAIPRYPSITRDIALVVNKEVSAGDIQSVIKVAAGKLLKQVHVFDLYEGERMEEGKKSVAFSLTYADSEKTLTDDEVVAAHTKVLESVKDQIGAELRN
jgi:phenylalanyl-tRNA synthetase beta chain